MDTATSPQDGPRAAPQVLAGRTLRMMRETHRVSLRDLAATVGISASHLSRVESGERPATADLTERLCAAIAGLPAARESA
jgi:transcriptional regulator with XRE-family HTH domain